MTEPFAKRSLAEETQSNVTDTLIAGAALVEPKWLHFHDIPDGGGSPFVVVPTGYKVEDLSRHLPMPTRRKGATVLHDLESFIRLVTEEVGLVTEEMDRHCRIYGTVSPAKFVAVFNDHAWGDHTASYECPLSDEWKLWIAQDGKPHSQEKFIELVENNMLDIIDPPSADMLEIVQRFEARKNSQFVKGAKLQDGTSELVWTETIEATAGRSAEPGGKGSFLVPSTFTLGIPVFQGGPRWKLEAKLRFRIGDGKLVLWYDLTQPRKVLETAWKDVRDRIEAPHDAELPGTGEKVFLGTR